MTMRKILPASLALTLAFFSAVIIFGCSSTINPPATKVQFTNGQAANVVIGQADFTSGLPNRGGAVAANTINRSFAQAFVTSAGVMYLPDERNNRTLVYNSIPTTNGASADFAIGQPDLTSNTPGVSATAVDLPEQAIISNGKLIQAEWGNNRVIIYNSVPTSGPGTIDVVVGQPNKTSNAAACDASTLDSPESVAVAGGKLIVADGNNNRVLIWNTIPTTDGVPADLVLGQTNFTTCTVNGTSGTVGASTLNLPAGMWSDGTRLAINDSSNNRVLIWNTIPTSNNQPADLVLGQADFTHNAVNQGGTASASSMDDPYDGVFFTSTQMFVGDEGNNRVLIWNTFPTTNGQAADVVLGQPNFTTTTNGTSATVMNGPTGVFLFGKQLIVSDTENSRYLIFNGN